MKDYKKKLIESGTTKKVNRSIFKAKYYIKHRNDYKKWIKANEPDEQAIDNQVKDTFKIKPKISIVIPLYNTNVDFLVDLIKSLKIQTYNNFEVILADGSSIKSEFLSNLAARDNRFKYEYLNENKGISENTNQGLKLVSGSYIGFMDHDDVLSPFALYELVKAINENKDADFFYSDEDKINEKSFYNDKYPLGNNEIRFSPVFKPDYSPETLATFNYITHFVVVKKTLLNKVGILNSDFDGAQDFDFNLRATKAAQNVVHIPKILYHWRISKGSTSAGNKDTKPYTHDAGEKVINNFLKDKKPIIKDGIIPGIRNLHYEVKGNPLVSIMIPSYDHLEYLKSCIDSILELTTYQNYEILVLENNSKNQETFNYYDEISKDKRIKIIKCGDGPFNYSKIINTGVKHAKGKYVVQLNNDTMLLTPDWLEKFIGYAQDNEIGCIGPKLYYKDLSIQSAGIGTGVCGGAANLMNGLPLGCHIYNNSEDVTIRNVSAVTGACLFCRKSLYKEVNGMDEVHFAIAFNDVDFCMKIMRKGYRNIYDPFVEFVHFESKSRGIEDTPEKRARFDAEAHNMFKMDRVLEEPDPYYNINFTREDGMFHL